MVEQPFRRFTAHAHIESVVHDQNDVNVVGPRFCGHIASENYDALQMPRRQSQRPNARMSDLVAASRSGVPEPNRAMTSSSGAEWTPSGKSPAALNSGSMPPQG